MRRLVGIAAAILLILGIGAPAVLAADPLPHDGSVRMAFGGDLTVAPDEHVDAVLVTGGTLTVRGEVNTIIVIDGEAILEGATSEAVVAVGSDVSLDADTVVLGDVRTFNGNVSRAQGAEVTGSVRGLESDFATFGIFLASVFILFAIGVAVAAVVAGLVLAGLAARQVRAAEKLIRTEPGPVLLAGILGAIVVPILAILAIITVVGAPVGIALLVGVLPVVAFVGYLVAGIFIGDWLLGRLRGTEPTGRPYAAAIVGILVLQVIGLIPLVGAIAGLFGFGAVILLAWRTFRTGRGVDAVTLPSGVQPMGA